MSVTTVYLDRLVTSRSSSVTKSHAAGVSTWTLPYTVATNGSEGTLVIVQADTFTVLTSTRPASNQIAVASPIDLTILDVYIGVSYRTLYRLSKIYLRDQLGNAITRGRLQLGALAVNYEDTTNLTARVTALGRTAREYTVAETALTDGVLYVPIRTQNEDATIELLTETPGAFNLESIDWDGDYHPTGRRKR